MTSPPRSVIKDRCIGALNAWGRVMSSTPEPKDPEMVGGGVFGWEPGEWTDDTQMALCIAHVTAEGQRIRWRSASNCSTGIAGSLKTQEF